MSESVYLKGEIVPAERARISVFDAGFAHAAGLFETLRAYRGKIMRLSEHVDRLNRSAGTLEIRVSITVDEIQQAIAEVLAANGLQDARVRMTVTPGEVPRPGARSAEASQTVLITATAVGGYPEEMYQRGMRVCICSYRQNRLDPLAGHKTLAYLPRLMAIKDAAERRCNEALWFTTDHQLAEGSICNVFIVKDGAIRTPPANTPILPGTVRKVVIETARVHGIACEEEAIDIDGLLEADEVFLTGSVLEVMPVTSIEKHIVGKGAPGDVTQRVAALYKGVVARECP